MRSEGLLTFRLANLTCTSNWREHFTNLSLHSLWTPFRRLLSPTFLKCWKWNCQMCCPPTTQSHTRKHTRTYVCPRAHTHTLHLSPSSTTPLVSFQHLSRWAVVLPLCLCFSLSVGSSLLILVLAIYIPSHRLRGLLPIVSIVLPWKWVKKDSRSRQKGQRTEKDGAAHTHTGKSEWEGEAKWPNQDGGEGVSDYMNT